jgi:methyl acetate hydrolase
MSTPITGRGIDGSAIDAVLSSAVDAGAAPNLVAVAADRDGVIYRGAAGPRTVGSPEPTSPDTMYRIASMTKMVTTVAALQLVERGALDLSAPVASYVPEYADIQVLEGFDGDTPRLRPPASAATVHQLSTHTAGQGYWFWNADLVRYAELTGTPHLLTGQLGSIMAPMVADPGTKLEYGTNTDWLGRVVEAASGESLDKYLAEHIFGPLGITSATFLMSPEQRAASTPIHAPTDNGWVPLDLDWSQDPEWWAGGHGLYITPNDHITFLRALLRGGELDGTRILQQSTVEDAFRNQIGDLRWPEHIETGDPTASCSFTLGPGWTWGHGLLLNMADLPGRRKAYSGAWAGLINAYFWIDPTTGVTGAIYSQFLPFVTQPMLDAYAAFETALYAAL